MAERKAARRAELPESEVQALRALPVPERNARLRALYDTGWSLSSLAAAFDPPRPRTTIRVWINQTSAPLKDSIELPRPDSKSSDPSDAAPRRRFSTPRRRRIGLPADTVQEIKALAPLARRHRPRTSPGNRYRVANEDLTRLTRELYSSGASIPELAEAAGVTYRAMYRRVRAR